MTFIRRSLEGKHGVKRYIGPKRFVLFALFLALIFWTWNVYQTGAFSPAIIEQYRSQYPVQAVVFFILLYAASVVACLPSLPLNLAAGFFWGGLLGGVISTLGVTLGGWLAFSVARGIFGQQLNRRFDDKWLAAVSRGLINGGWKYVAFARINPIIPSGPLNYLLGLTSLTTKAFIVISLVFILPPSVAVAYIGDTLQTFTTHQIDVEKSIKSILIISAAITFLVAIQFFATNFKRNAKFDNEH